MGDDSTSRQRLACLLCLFGPAGLLAFRVVIDGIMKGTHSAYFGLWVFGAVQTVLLLSQLLGVIGMAMLAGALRNSGRSATRVLFRGLLICCGVLFVLVILNYLVWLIFVAGGEAARNFLFRLLMPARTAIFNTAFAICWIASLSTSVLVACGMCNAKLKRGVQLLARITVILLVLSFLLVLLCQFSYEMWFGRFSPQIGLNLTAVINWLFPVGLLGATLSFAASLIHPKTKPAMYSGDIPSSDD